jgi:GrpB-like predicted nucleotidyltransferase (UPF0157 family)
MDVIGLESGVVRLLPYSDLWPRLYEAEKARIHAAVGRWVLDIQHVGSTAIPGMPAKPIIDIAVAVADFEEARICIVPLERLGYEYRGELGIPRRHYFTRGDPRTHHVHMNELGSRDWGNQVLFRDYLIRHPGQAEAYAALKQRLARQYSTDRDAYLAGKAAFIEGILRRARSGTYPK